MSMLLARPRSVTSRVETRNSSVTSLTTIDSVSVDLVSTVKWLVYVQGTQESDANKKIVLEITATHDGHTVGSGLDATDTSFTTYSKLTMGTIVGFTHNVVLTGSGLTQAMALQVSSTTEIDIYTLRLSIKF